MLELNSRYTVARYVANWNIARHPNFANSVRSLYSAAMYHTIEDFKPPQVRSPHYTEVVHCARFVARAPSLANIFTAHGRANDCEETRWGTIAATAVVKY